MVSFILGLAVTAALFYISALYKSASLLMFGYAGAGLLILAALFLSYRMHTIQCGIAVPISIAECGKPLTVQILLDNHSVLPCLKFRCLMEQKSHFLNRKDREWMQGGLAASGKNRFDYSFLTNNYGSYHVQMKKVRVYDLTGLFYFQKKVGCGVSVQVLPKMQEIGVHISEASRNFFGEADVYDEFRPGDDHSELFQMREFRPGDKIQRIHWKLSAKQEELLVKEDSMPKACPVALFLDYKNVRRRRAENVNAYLVILAAISFSLMDAGCPHYAVWYSSRREDIVRVRVDDEESLFLFLSSYLEETFQKQTRDLVSAYQDKYKGEHYLFAFQLDECLRLRKNGEIIRSFHLENWKKELETLEIIA